MAYKLEITNPQGVTVDTYIYSDDEIRGALRIQHGIDLPQINFAMDVLNTTQPGGMFDLSIVEETDSAQAIIFTARLSKYQGPNYG